MSRTLTDPVDDALQAAHKQEVTFVEMAFDSGTVRASTAPHSIDWNSYTWLGLARIGSISPIEEAGQLEARSITLGLSGIPSAMVSTAMGEHYQGRPVNLWLGVYTTDPALRFAFNTDTATPTHGSGTLSVVRGSAGGRYNSSGVYESISSNLPRFTYDPSSLVARGLLVEQQTINRFTRSEYHAATWQNLFPLTATLTTGIAGPDGANNAVRFDVTGPTSALLRNTSLSYTLSAGVTHSFSFFAKATTMPTTAANADVADGQPSGNYLSQLSLNNWRRPYLTGSRGSDTAVAFADIWSDYFAAVSSVDYHGLQLEANPFPTSYVPSTAGSQTTRSADTITCTTTGVATAAGTVRITARTAIGAGTQTLWSIDDGTADERIYIQRNSSNEIHALVVDGGVTQADLTLGTVAHDTDFVVVLAWAANSVAGCLNGGSLVVDGAGTMPTVTTNRYGHDYATANHWNSTIAVWESWPARLDDACLLSLAAGEDNTQPVLADPVGPITYRIDNMTIELGATATVNLTAHSRLADWDRARLKHFNDADQQADYPGDRFCEHAEEMVEKQILW